MHAAMAYAHRLQDGRWKNSIGQGKAEVVKEIFINYINGLSLIKIAQELTTAGFPNANNKPSWNHGSVGRILENIKYMGDTIYPQIIDEKKHSSLHRNEGSQGIKN